MSETPRPILSKSDPLTAARNFLATLYAHVDRDRLLYAMDSFFEWEKGPAWAEFPVTALRRQGYEFLELHDRVKANRDGTQSIVPFQPTKGDVDQIIDALKALTFVNAIAPSWIGEADDLPDTRKLVIARNGILDLSKTTPQMFTPTPALFTTNALPFDYDPAAESPSVWLDFIETLWPNDPESRDALQEFMGLSLTHETRFQKGLLVVGPMRAGKGSIARVWGGLLGTENIAGPTLSSFSQNFGLWPLIGKQLAIVSDARLSGRSDQAIITERILSITGEDTLTIDRKNQTPLTLKLSARIVLMTNELPRLADSSGALANRWIILRLTESFIGREDHGLTDRLMAELPSILNWAIEGWKRLQARGRFIQPQAGQDAIDELLDLGSPVGAFVREWCEMKPGERVEAKELFRAWQVWCTAQGRHDAGTIQIFGRDLSAAFPAITTSQPRMNGDRIRCYDGIGLTVEATRTMTAHAFAPGHGASQSANGRNWGART